MLCKLAYPPVRMEKWECQTVHDFVCMMILVRVDLYSDREAVQAEVKVRTNGAFDAYHASDILLAVIAMIQASACANT